MITRLPVFITETLFTNENKKLKFSFKNKFHDEDEESSFQNNEISIQQVVFIQKS